MTDTAHPSSEPATAPAAPIWDGKLHSYIPASDWQTRVSPDLPLHDDFEAEVDPVTYEVIRNRLWTINIAHGETMTRISGSPSFQGLDFNMSIAAEDGETIMNAPYIQFLNGGATFGIRYILEHYSGNPGIHEGDMFFGNDPWISATHQMDMQVNTPVFIDGRLFAWISSAAHQYDLGGISPGGWPQGAPDVYSDPIILPHFKFVERGMIREDLEQVLLRQSRMPDFVSLDFRAGLIGSQQARDALIDLCDRFGAATVKGVMKGILDRSQESFKAKLRRIPDGRWSQVKYSAEALPGDKSVMRVQVNFTKEGDRLTVDNHGTDVQAPAGPAGITFSPFMGAVTTVVALNLLYEHLFAIGGAFRQIDFDVTPGLLNTVDYPAAVAGGIGNVQLNVYAMQVLVSRMLSCDPELASDIVGPDPDYPLFVVQGVNDRGEGFGQALLDGFANGRGALNHRDGIDSGGPMWSPLTRLLNVEDVEQWYPLVYLYRRETADTAGAGRWRGGNGATWAVTPYRARTMAYEANAFGAAVSVVNAEGLFGGNPSTAGSHHHAAGTDVAERFAAGHIPQDLAALEHESLTRLPGKLNATTFAPGDVLEAQVMGGGGYGDPLLREPARVLEDLANGYVSREAAEAHYAIVFSSAGDIDAEATAAARDAIRAERATWTLVSDVHGAAAPVEALAATGGPDAPVHESVVARDAGGERVLACRHCGEILCGYRSDYKRSCLMLEAPLTEIAGAVDPGPLVDQTVLFRQICCPGCQTMLGTEVFREGDPMMPDMLLS
ncbi:hydantoinase B/oxoprolinase family protein [Patulibacter sp. NPDC049589]|uniref:hydantoinase B/oxoprolinase family protein n=1 Tax=Patulibacter sp. NPDC049589 TaxID=3154731 RepID=UPI003439D298